MSIKDILDAIAEVEGTPDGRDIELRMSFSKIVLERLGELGWTQKKLAKEAKKKESYVSRLLNGNENFSCGKAAEILFAIGANAEFARIVEAPASKSHATEYQVTGPNGDRTAGAITIVETAWTATSSQWDIHNGEKEEDNISRIEGPAYGSEIVGSSTSNFAGC